MTMAEGVDWAAWSANGGLYMDNLGLNGATHTSLEFLQASNHYFSLGRFLVLLKVTNLSFLTSLLTTHTVSNLVPEQNNRNTNNGGSGWFFYHG